MRRTLSRRVEENEVKEETPSQVEEVEDVSQGAEGYQVPIVGIGDVSQSLLIGILERYYFL